MDAVHRDLGAGMLPKQFTGVRVAFPAWIIARRDAEPDLMALVEDDARAPEIHVDGLHGAGLELVFAAIVHPVTAMDGTFLDEH